MKQIIKGSAPFVVPTSKFSISKSAQAFTLQVCVDYDWSTHQTTDGFVSCGKQTEIGDVTIVNHATPGLTYRLYGNTSNVTLIYGDVE